MSAERRRGQSFDLRGSMVVGSAFGDHATVRDNVFSVGDRRAPPTLEELRAALAEVRPQLLDAAVNEQDRSAVERRLGQLEAELEEPEPAGDLVGSLWAQVRKLAGPLAASASIAQITDLIITLFGS